MQMTRLNKYLAECGVCSRRDADKLIEEGFVTINSKTAVMGQQVFPNDEVFVKGKKVGNKNEKVVFAFYKPRGVTCTEKDRFADLKVTDMVKSDVRVTYAGRLDKDSEGLILMTNDGDLINRLMKGSNDHEKEYEVHVNKEVTPEFLDSMSRGIFLRELNITTKPCRVKKIGKKSFSIVLTQGVNRQIRRMCKEEHYYVTFLKRVRVANIALASLNVGEYRQIKGLELQTLYNISHK